MTAFFRKNKRFRMMMISLISIFCFVGVATAVLLLMVGCQAGSLAPAREYNERYSRQANFAGGRFVNAEKLESQEASKGDFANTVNWLFGGAKRRPDFTLPTVQRTRNDFSAEPGKLKFYWLGHSTVLMEIDGVRILTDPIFGSPGPFPFLVKRFQPSPLMRDELPKLDLVIITHDHYDHLEKDTIEYLKSSTAHFVVPLGVDDRLKNWGIPPERIHTLNWEESCELNGLKITAVEAHHFSGRGVSDRDRTLWCSYILNGPGHKVFFGGDSGYGKHFAETGRKHGPFDVVLLEIGAWDEDWPDLHLFPEQTIRAYGELNGRLLLPIHYAAFDLALHAWDEPIKRALAAAEKAQANLFIPMMGQEIIPTELPSQKQWWVKGGNK